jgi:hypothetical protein
MRTSTAGKTMRDSTKDHGTDMRTVPQCRELRRLVSFVEKIEIQSNTRT